jgi:hypothetical protein
MRSPSSRAPLLRLRTARGRLLCLLRLPGRPVRELALVLGPAPPYLRRLTVLRHPGAPRRDGGPRVA